MTDIERRRVRCGTQPQGLRRRETTQRLEDTPNDPGMVSSKQNAYLETGEISMMHRDWPRIGPSTFDLAVEAGEFGRRVR